MGNRKSTTTGNNTERTCVNFDPVNNTVMLTKQTSSRLFQNYFLVWLDEHMNETDEYYKNSLKCLQHIVISIKTFTNVQECIYFVGSAEKEKIFFIISDSLEPFFISKVQSWPQIESVYVLTRNRSRNIEHNNKTVSKVKGIFTDIDFICKLLQIDTEHCDQNLISMRFSGIDSLFTYTQSFKEILLETYDDENAFLNFVEYCRKLEDFPRDLIETIAREYYNHTPLWWYTTSHFVRSMINRALRVLDIDILFNMRFFIQHLHEHLKQMHHVQQSAKQMIDTFQVYRFQVLSNRNFKKLKQTKGELMSFNNFLSTNRSRKIALENSSRPVSLATDSTRVLFAMTIDPKVCTSHAIPFFDDQNQTILFSTHTTFRIDRIERIQNEHADQLWQVDLTLTDGHQRKQASQHMDDEIYLSKDWPRLGLILTETRHYTKAEHLYQLLLANKSLSDENRANYSFQLGRIYTDLGEYSKALSYYEQSLSIMEKTLSSDHLDLASYYNNIGLLHYNMGKYAKALSCYQRALNIRLKNLPSHHASLASSYNNIGLIFCAMGEYSQALSYYKQTLEIDRQILPSNHPDLASSYNNIGLAYYKMGEYSKALSYQKLALDIRQKILPSNHIDIASSYNNIGLIYQHTNQYTKALSFYRKDLEINKKHLPRNHPDLAISYNNIGLIYKNIGDYEKALTNHREALHIRQKSLDSNHPNLASSYNNIGLVYESMQQYSKALSYYEKTLEIDKKSLLPCHPNLVQTHKNIERMKRKLHES